MVTSQFVIDEAGMGDPDAASRRLEVLRGIPVLPVNPDADTVADEIIRRSMMPSSARIDALHVATREGKRGQDSFVRSTFRAVPANES